MFIASFLTVLIVGFLAGYVLNKIKIPGLVGMILIGVLFGPFVLNIIDPKILNISSELRQIALVIILTRSGLNLNLKDLKKIGRPAILMCFVPATFEIIGVMLASRFLLNLSWVEGLLLGSVLGAVSPAVVVPRMTKLMDQKYGEKNHVPELVLAGASADDIYTIILFYSFLGLAQTGTFDFLNVVMIPVSIISGIGLGIAVGILLVLLFKHAKIHRIFKILILLIASIGMVYLERVLKPYFSISSLLGIMVVGIIILFKNKDTAIEIKPGYNKLWKIFEVILFVLVGAAVDIRYAAMNTLPCLGVLAIGLAFRSIGVFVCLIKTNLTFKERLFAFISYLPKATVQASIGGIALSLGLPCGQIVLSCAVLAILITAPVGAFLIDLLSSKLLDKDKNCLYKQLRQSQ